MTVSIQALKLARQLGWETAIQPPRGFTPRGIHETGSVLNAYALLRDRSTDAVVMSVVRDGRADAAEQFGKSVCEDPPLYRRAIGSAAAILREAASFLPGNRDGRTEYLSLLAERISLFRYLTGAETMHCSIRNHFWPLDCIWHYDPVMKVESGTDAPSLRMVWAVGRNLGPMYTGRHNVNVDAYGDLLKTHGDYLTYIRNLAVRNVADAIPAILESPDFVRVLADQNRSFLHDPNEFYSAPPDDLAFHRLGHPMTNRGLVVPGTFHRASFDNFNRPGLQIILSVVNWK